MPTTWVSSADFAWLTSAGGRTVYEGGTDITTMNGFRQMTSLIEAQCIQAHGSCVQGRHEVQTP